MTQKKRKRQSIGENKLNDLLNEGFVRDYAITNMRGKRFIDRVYSINKWVSFIAEEGENLRGVEYFASIAGAGVSSETPEQQEAYMLRYDHLKQFCPRLTYCNNPEFLDTANFIINYSTNNSGLRDFVGFVEKVIEIGEKNPTAKDLKYSDDEIKETTGIVKETIESLRGRTLSIPQSSVNSKKE